MNNFCKLCTDLKNKCFFKKRVNYEENDEFLKNDKVLKFWKQVLFDLKTKAGLLENSDTHILSSSRQSKASKLRQKIGKLSKQ